MISSDDFLLSCIFGGSVNRHAFQIRHHVGCGFILKDLKTLQESNYCMDSEYCEGEFQSPEHIKSE